MIRYIVLVLTTCILALNTSGIICLSATYPTLTNTVGLNESIWDNSSSDLIDRRFDFKPIHKTLLFGGGFAGTFFGVLPLCEILRKYHNHKVVTITSILCAIILISTPLILSYSIILYIIVRFIQSWLNAHIIAIAGEFLYVWAPKKEIGFFSAVVLGLEISVVFTMPISGFIISKFGWPTNFYFHGFCLALVTLLWSLLYRDIAENQPIMSEKEKRLVNYAKDLSKTTKTIAVPYLAIIKTPAVWAIWIACAGNFTIAQFNFTYSYIYLRSALKYSVSEAGLLLFVQMNILLFIRIMSGYLSDAIKFINEKLKIRLINSIGFFGSASFFLYISHYPLGESKYRDHILYTLTTTIYGFASGGFGKTINIVSGKHSTFVCSIIQITSCIVGVSGSYIIPVLAPNDKIAEWNHVFIVYAIMLIVTNIFFVIFVGTKPVDWENANRGKNSNIIHSLENSNKA
ncbi:unnamed protein product [Caenorhabditis angaria]|uniref:Major facilitator superfamily (MFS) profile domain-containing protein n=1 Tax=Caenorhabditis angaria TaxID=860376 RepID=A0A9P1IC10_9PELO|nr:unnamed protein product [Caenorhabditis angaria]